MTHLFSIKVVSYVVRTLIIHWVCLEPELTQRKASEVRAPCSKCFSVEPALMVESSILLQPHVCTAVVFWLLCPQHSAELEDCQLYSYPLKYSSLFSERWCLQTVAFLNFFFFHSHSWLSIIKNQNDWSEGLFNRASARDIFSCITSIFITNCTLQLVAGSQSTYWIIPSWQSASVCALRSRRKYLAKSTLNWSEDQAVPLDWEDLELYNKDFVTLIQFSKSLIRLLLLFFFGGGLNSVMGHDYIHMAWEWLHMTVLKKICCQGNRPCKRRLNITST